MAQGLLKFFIVLGIIAAIFPACGHGTETGNPSLPGVPSDEPDAEDGSGVDASSDCPGLVLGFKSQGTGLAEEETDYNELVERLCLNIFLCDNSIGTLHCIDRLTDSEGDPIAAIVGPAGFDFTADQLQNELRNGTALTDSEGFATCKADIDAIDCSVITNSINVDDFSQVADILPDSCTEIFVIVPEAAADGDLACP